MLQSLTADQFSLAGDIIGHSFADDPVNEWIFRNQRAMTHFIPWQPKSSI